MRKVNILGTEYTLVETDKGKDGLLDNMDGYCDTSVKLCVVDSMEVKDADAKKDLQVYKKGVMRHELIHAFLYESGLDTCSWAQNEELVDWIALQFPKMLQTFKDADCL